MNFLIVRSAVAAGVLLAGFQLPTTPPMKLGLWESSSTITMQMPGMQMPAMPPRSVKVRVCLTAETWAKALSNNNGRMNNCTRTHESYSAGHYSVDVSCPEMNGTGHFEMAFSGQDSSHGTMHMDMSPQGRHMIADSVVDSHFVSSDCGSVTPDHPQMVQ
jgi:hypothetical protein